MKKFINEPKHFVDEMLEGILLAHPDQLAHAAGDRRCIVRAGAPRKGKVGIATGGGSGHIPVFLGYVGPGLCDGVCVGNVFSSPPPDAMLAVTKAIDGGAGVLYLYGNYGGDVMNFDMAVEMADMEGIAVRTVLAHDDVVSAPPQEAQRRRAVAGLYFAYKIAGAYAEEGASLDAVAAAAQRAADNTRSMGVALAPCTVPAAGKPTFTIGEDEMELGMGIHGEPGLERSKLKSADEIATAIVDKVVNDLPFRRGDEVAVLVNGLGATPPEELFVLYRKAHEQLLDRGIKIHKALIGEYATSLEMAGASISLLKLDDELKRWLDAPAFSPFILQQRFSR